MLVSVNTPHEISTHPFGMRLADGTVIVPELVMISDDRQAHPFRMSGFIGGALAFTSEMLPVKMAFTEIRLRSERPIEVSAVKYGCFNFQDIKR